MKSYLAVSSVVHGTVLAGLILFTTIFNKPRLSYYAVDVFSGPPAGAASASMPEVPAEAPVEDEPVAPQKPEPPVKDTIKVQDKLKPKPKPAKSKPEPVKPKPSISGALRSLAGSASAASGSATTGTGTGAAVGGSGLVAEAGGQAFPFPWYLKAITDKLDEQWKPEQFQNDTVCQVTFVVARDGRVSGVTLRKSSGDTIFDQMAIRAVQAADPMPPLPGGFPEDRLMVHMKFIGKQ